jgi:hypothetical protein
MEKIMYKIEIEYEKSIGFQKKGNRLEIILDEEPVISVEIDNVKVLSSEPPCVIYKGKKYYVKEII